MNLLEDLVLFLLDEKNYSMACAALPGLITCQKVWPDDDMCDESLDCVLSHLTVLAGSESAYLC